jgi:hypothetical protein
MRHLSAILFILITIAMTNIISAQSQITIMPGDSVEVGEEIYFDAVYYSNQYGDSMQCEWDFGDGYYFKAGAPFDHTFETGLAVVHYFMIPGMFNVKLTVSRFDMSTSPPTRGVLLAADSVTVIVTGEAPLAGFELWHAPFHARTAQYLYATVPAGYNPSQVSARVESDGGEFTQELAGITEGDKQKFLLENAALPAGDYVITAELMSGAIVVSRIREKLSKPYDGSPVVGINENNAFILNGTTLFFPIGPYMLNEGIFPLWSHCSNTLNTEGWYETHNADTWIDYLSKVSTFGLLAIGPGRWEGFIQDPYTRNSNPNDLAVYVEQAKNYAGLLGWCWDDEPNMGGRYLRVPAFVLEAWSYRTSRIDVHHPSAQQYYGFDYFDYPNNDPHSGDHAYSFMRSSASFGGKKAFIADFFTHDAYLMEYKEHISLDFPDRGALDLWLENLDTFNWNMAGLVPLGTFIEPQNVTSYARMTGTSYLTEWDAGPEPGDVRCQAWGAIIHGMKYIGYFEFFAPTPADNMSAMAELKEAVTSMAPVILSVPSTRAITHNAATRGNRVDIMVRETDADIYIFAVRVTEPESEWNEVYEPETINFQFNTGLNVSTAYDELGKYRWNYMLVDATAEQMEFNFTLPGSGVNPGSFIVSAVKNPVPAGIPDILYDRWTGKGYPTALDMPGNLKYGYDDGAGNVTALYAWEGVTGTVDYATGNVYLKFDQGLPAGSGFVQVAYAPAGRQARAISGNNGIFTDVLERNAVRIYRIPAIADSGPNGNDLNEFRLYQNYPNPFNSVTSIRFDLPEASRVKIVLYNILGQRVAEVRNKTYEQGTHSIPFNSSNLSTGMYIIRAIITSKQMPYKRYDFLIKMMIIK